MVKNYHQPTAPNSNHHRYSKTPLPPYHFIPGLSPHPRRDPDGHSHNQVEEKLSFIDPVQWQQNPEYLDGIDLYNYAYWWESHEAWESVWHTTDKNSIYGQHLQGLIQISAAFIKWYLNQPEGLLKLYNIGMSRLEFVATQSPTFMGLDMISHIGKIKKHFAPVVKAAVQTWPDPLVGYPFIVLDS